MDNLFEILIYAIIIISFLSSFFKKKKKEVPQTNKDTQDSELEDLSSQQSEPVLSQKKEVDDYDILREIEKMFKVETASQSPPVPKKVEPVRSSQPAPGSEKRKISSEHRLTKSEHVVSKSITYDGQNYKPAPKAVSDSNEEKYFPINQPVINPFLNLKRKLRDPQTVRDYIIVSEVIGRPKALKR